MGEEILAALYRLRDFSAPRFSFERMSEKIIALLDFEGESGRLIHNWIVQAVSRFAEVRGALIYGDVLGIAGEISGMYEAIFKQKTTLAGIKLGTFAEIDMMVVDEGGIGVKEFDAVATEKRAGDGEAIVTVFEFKFALSLRKLYEQVIGIDSAKLPHLVVLTRYRQFDQVRNLVYFGETGDGHITQAIRQFIAVHPTIAARLRLTRKGYSIKLSLPEVAELLCDPVTIRLAERAGDLGLSGDPDSVERRKKIRQMRGIIDRKIAQERNRGNAKFDIIVAVSNAPKRHFADLRKLHHKIQSINSPRDDSGGVSRRSS